MCLNFHKFLNDFLLNFVLNNFLEYLNVWNVIKKKSLDYYCVQAVSETQCLFNRVYSMILSTKLSEYLYQMATGENRVGCKQRGREREREQQINGVRVGVLGGFRNGMGWKWPLGKRTPKYVKKIKGIEQIQRQSDGILIILGGSQSLHSLCCDFSSLDDVSHHTISSENL